VPFTVIVTFVPAWTCRKTSAVWLRRSREATVVMCENVAQLPHQLIGRHGPSRGLPTSRTPEGGTSVNLNADEIVRLTALAAREGTSQADVIRQAIRFTVVGLEVDDDGVVADLELPAR